MNKQPLWKIRPLTPLETACLVTLATNDSCAYGLAEAIRRDGYHKVSATASAVSQALKRLEEQVCVKVRNPSVENRREGRVYFLTDFGAE